MDYHKEKQIGDEDDQIILHDGVSEDRISEDGDNSSEIFLSRDFKSRHVSMFSVASAIGTGLIIGSGTGLKRGGPASLFLGYLFTGSLLVGVIFSLGEMASFCPMDKGFSGYCTKYVDPALGFAAGWNYFLKYAIVFSSNLTAAGLIIQYWLPNLNVAVWVSVFYVIIVAINYLGSKYYGELEFWFAVTKLLILVMIFIICIVISSGGGPTHETIGFRYWRETPFLEYLVSGSKGRFLGFFACVCQLVFAVIGSETIGIVFGEAKDPKNTIPRASKQILIRIGFVYILGVFLLGISVSPNNPQLVSALGTNADASPFVIAIKVSGIKVLPSFINACLLMFVLSTGISDLYICSRQLYGLAKDGAAPKIFLKMNKFNIPFIGCLFAAIFGVLAYMNVKESSAESFGYITSTVSVFGILNWAYILISYIGFHRAVTSQDVPSAKIPFKMWFQPYSAYVTLFFVLVITFFFGYGAFVPKFDYKIFITSYIGVFVNIALYAFFKLWFKTKLVNPYTVDLRR
ncbi:uncharacterized protein PRCAT00002495001 [Priceomyces carsonii]|uniref:uncharacterized protein n=1 Tax=Priceomyces carsonii TaxID=28549 RepID=UPI002ED8ACD4|nr:unnamed protein product [Priceomyces carsonii]